MLGTAGVRLRSQKRVDESEDALRHRRAARPQFCQGGTYSRRGKMSGGERRLAEVCTVTYDDGPELSAIYPIEVSVTNSAATHRIRVLFDTVATMVR